MDKKEIKKLYDKFTKYSDQEKARGVYFVEAKLDKIEGKDVKRLAFIKAEKPFTPGQYAVFADHGTKTEINETEAGKILEKINANDYTLTLNNGKVIPEFDYKTHTKFRKVFGKIKA